MFLQLSFQIEAEHTDLACWQARISSAVRVEERFDGGLALIMINRAKPLADFPPASVAKSSYLPADEEMHKQWGPANRPFFSCVLF